MTLTLKGEHEAAREVQKRIPDTNLIVTLLDKDVVTTNGETVGFASPYKHDHSGEKKSWNLDLMSATYILAIATRGGTLTASFQMYKETIDGTPSGAR
jgi:hypothetical protein